MTTEKVIEWFERWLRQRGLAEHTAQAYASDLGDYLEVMGGPGPGILSEGHIRQYLDDLSEEGYAPTTIARRLTSLRRFSHVLMARDVLPVDPTEGISVPISDAHPPRPDWDDIVAVLVAPDPYAAIGLRDRAMMMLLMDTGMELRELCALDLVDCSHDAEQVVVGSDRRLRKVGLTASQRPLLCYLCWVREDQYGEPLFLSNRGNRISTRAVQHRVKHYADAEGVAVTVEDLIHRGRKGKSHGNLKWAAKKLGFARPDALKRRYGAPPPEPAPAPEDDDFEHPFLKPLNGMDPRGMPFPRTMEERPPDRRDMWDRVESELIDRMRVPRRAASRWVEVTGLIDLEPADRLRAYAKPVAKCMKAMREDGELPRGVRAILGDEVRRAAYQSDTGLLLLHDRVVESIPELGMWARLHGQLPVLHGRTKRMLGVSSDEPDWTEGMLAMDIFGSPERVFGWADQTLRTREGQKVLWTLIGTQSDRLSWMRQCAAEYHDIPDRQSVRRELDAALVVASIAALVLCDPQAVERTRMSEAIQEPATMYFLDTVTYVLHQLLRLLGLVEDGPRLADIEGDEAFVEAFEREWNALLPYTNGFFGFAVVPSIRYEAMVRYHRLRYEPHGDLTEMPYEVGDYLVHQAKASGHFLRSFVAERLHEAFFDCVRPLYDSLLRDFKRKAKNALTQKRREQDGDTIIDRGEREPEAAFREAYDRYDFYQHPPGGPQTTVAAGLLGWRRREDIKRLAADLGIDCEQARTPFAAYARGHLTRLVKRFSRESVGEPRGVRVQGPDEKYYYTINRMADRFERSASFLRDLDDLLEPTRVSEVFGDRRTGRKSLPGATRLYPADAESMKEYDSLLSAQHPRLKAEGLRTETQVAEWLGVTC